MKNLPLNYPGLHQNGYLCYTCRRWLVIAGGRGQVRAAGRGRAKLPQQHTPHLPVLAVGRAP